MQIGTRISFGDSCGPWSCACVHEIVLALGVLADTGVGRQVVLLLVEDLLLLDVVRGVVGDEGANASSSSCSVVVRTGGGATRLAEEREVRRPHGVGGGEERPAEGDPHEHRVAVVADVVDDLVLGEEPGEREDAGQRQAGDDPRARP